MTVRKVLCVDDSAAELSMIKQIVLNANLGVVSATNGKDAILLAKSEMPDLIFLDIVMSDMDGFAVMRELHKDPATKHIPVVFVSSKSQKADLAWAKMQGASGFVPKPVSEKAILEEIKKVLMIHLRKERQEGAPIGKCKMPRLDDTAAGSTKIE